MDELRETVAGVIRQRANRGLLDRDAIAREVMRLHPGVNVVHLRRVIQDVALDMDSVTRRRMRV